jgi:calcium permeable stress-gated cation channel
VRLVGMDAAIFMRFTIMCRNIFVVLSVLGCAILVPVNMEKSVRFEKDTWLQRLGPLNVYGEPQWALVVVSWLTNLIVCFFLWWNYRKVLQLRRTYFESPEYQMSLHARTLMVSTSAPILGQAV